VKCYNGTFVRLRIIYVCIKKYQQAFLAPLPGNGCCIFFEPSSSSYLYLFIFIKITQKNIFTMKTTPIQYRPISKGEFREPCSKPISSGYKLHPSLIAKVRAQPFSGHDNENPCQHLQEFEEMCSCLSIFGMTQETLKWKLFPFSPIEKAKQWYKPPVESTNGEWDELKDKFQLAFFPISRIDSLPRVILDFEQYEKESCSLGQIFSVNTCRPRLVFTRKYIAV
jgi:hypothetical protein